MTTSRRERTVEIAPSVLMPLMGLGTFRSTGQDVRRAVHAALACGYRHIDTASVYKNEQDIALALDQWRRRRQLERAAAGASSSTSTADADDDSVFITSKISPYEMGEARAQAAFDAIVQRLNGAVVDLVLVHWPGAARTKPDSPKHAIARRETWKVLVGRGVSGGGPSFPLTG